MKKKLLLIGFIFFHCLSYSQEDAWVFFNAKENVEDALSNPITILTQKAIDRKMNHGVEIDFRDVPVNESYITQIKNAAGISVWAKSKWFNAVHVRGSETDINALLGLGFVDHVEFANRDLNSSRMLIPVGDKFESEGLRVNFTYGNTENQVEMLNLHLLHQMDYTANGITVAILDAGFANVNNLDGFERLRNAGNLLNGYDFVNRVDDEFAFSGNDHGTKVLSTMAGFVQDEFVGTAPDASYYLFRTEDVFSENPVEESYWVEAAERADSLGVDVINTSLGYKGYDNINYSYAAEDLDGETAYITRGANIAADKGLLLVNSAGNSGASGVNAPADAAGVFSIGAVDANGDYASFSSQGSLNQPTHKPDVMARGAASFVISFAGTIVQNNGTSFSSPILAGAVACLWQALPEMTNVQIMDFIRQSSSQYETPDFMMGYGIPDFNLALDIGLTVQSSTQIEFKAFPNPVTDQLQFIFPNEIEQAQLFIFDILGKLVYDLTLSDNENVINLESLASGLYLARFQGDNNTSKTFKLIKD